MKKSNRVKVICLNKMYLQRWPRTAYQISHVTRWYSFSVKLFVFIWHRNGYYDDDQMRTNNNIMIIIFIVIHIKENHCMFYDFIYNMNIKWFVHNLNQNNSIEWMNEENTKYLKDFYLAEENFIVIYLTYMSIFMSSHHVMVWFSFIYFIMS